MVTDPERFGAATSAVVRIEGRRHLATAFGAAGAVVSNGGEGVLRVGGKVDSYYTSASASFGLQAGGTTFGYIMFLMTDDAISYLKRTDGWEVGVGPSYVIGDEKYASKYTTTTEESGVVIFFVNQEGAFAGGGIEGTKITQGLIDG